MTERRTSYEIYWEILVFCRQPHSPTSIINRCDLNSKIGQQHIDLLATKHYLTRTETNAKTTYQTTPQGDSYIQLFTQLYKGLFENTPDFKLS